MDATAHETSAEGHAHLLPHSDRVTVVITQAFGPEGHNLVGYSNVTFNGYPALTVLVRTPEGREGLVHLSPIYGDKRKRGFTDIAPGTRCILCCPATGLPLEKLGPVGDGSGADHYALYLTTKMLSGHAIALSDVWDHHESLIIDDAADISYWGQVHPI